MGVLLPSAEFDPILTGVLGFSDGLVGIESAR